MSDEIMSGSINIFNILIKISPGKEIRRIASSDQDVTRAVNPMTSPSMTPAIVRTSRAFVLSHNENCMHRVYEINSADEQIFQTECLAGCDNIREKKRRKERKKERTHFLADRHISVGESDGRLNTVTAAQHGCFCVCFWLHGVRLHQDMYIWVLCELCSCVSCDLMWCKGNERERSTDSGAAAKRRWRGRRESREESRERSEVFGCRMRDEILLLLLLHHNNCTVGETREKRQTEREKRFAKTGSLWSRDELPLLSLEALAAASAFQLAEMHKRYKHTHTQLFSFSHTENIVVLAKRTKVLEGPLRTHTPWTCVSSKSQSAVTRETERHSMREETAKRKKTTFFSLHPFISLHFACLLLSSPCDNYHSRQVGKPPE